MFKGYNNRQPNGFPNLNFRGDISAYGYGGVTFWLDAAFGLNTQTNGGAISSWVEKIQGINFTQTTVGGQPSLVLNDAAFNNLPTINTSANRFLQNSTSGLSVSSSSTVAFIAKYDSANTGNTIMGSTVSSGTLISLGGTAGGYTGVGWRDQALNWFTSSVENANAKICVISLNNIIINGANVFNNNSNTIFPDTLLNDIGRAASGLTFLNGKIAEILHYNYTMTNTQMIQLSDNINQKYALY